MEIGFMVRRLALLGCASAEAIFSGRSEKADRAKIQESIDRIRRALDSIGEKIESLERNAVALQKLERSEPPEVPLMAGGFPRCGNA